MHYKSERASHGSKIAWFEHDRCHIVRVDCAGLRSSYSRSMVVGLVDSECFGHDSTGAVGCSNSVCIIGWGVVDGDDWVADEGFVVGSFLTTNLKGRPM